MLLDVSMFRTSLSRGRNVKIQSCWKRAEVWRNKITFGHVSSLCGFLNGKA